MKQEARGSRAGGTRRSRASRDITAAAPASSLDVPEGRLHLVTIGIDAYQHCSKLKNAVGDAEGARRAFEAIGFESHTHLLNEEATQQAMERLPKDRLRNISVDDSLVIFFAGHGCAVPLIHADETRIKTGYIVPVDGDAKQPGTCVRLRTWLDEITELPPRHILVILDACKSGIALEPMTRFHGQSVYSQVRTPMDRLRQRRSRRIFTSALDDEFASDRGPYKGNSLFTGYLIEALSGGVKLDPDGTPSSVVSSYVKQHVMTFPRSRQTPDFGALQLDDRGELVISPPEKAETGEEPAAPEETHQSDEHSRGSRSDGRSRRGKKRSAKAEAATKPVAAKRAGRKKSELAGTRSADLEVSEARDEVEDRAAEEEEEEVAAATWLARRQAAQATFTLRASAGSIEPRLVAALDRHASQRRHGAPTLSTMATASEEGVAAISTYHAQRGALTLITSATTIDAAIFDLLSQMPWPRCLAPARAALCRAAKIEPSSLEAHLQARSEGELARWFESLSAGNPAVRVAGWLVTCTRDPREPYDVSSAPLQGRELLTALGDLGCPFAIVVHHAEPSAEWLQQAVGVAATLLTYLPRQSICLAAPGELLSEVLERGRDSGAKAMARQGRISAVPRLSGALGEATLLDEEALGERLLAALERDPRSKGCFERRVLAPIHEDEREVLVMLAARRECLLVELDRWYHVREADAYRRARRKDIWLQRAGFLSLRFPAEDLAQRLSSVVDEICAGLMGRRAAALFL